MLRAESFLAAFADTELRDSETLWPNDRANLALSLPSRRDEHGMPFGLQMIGPLRNDAQLLAMARALEQAWAGGPERARPVPNLAPPSP